MLIDSDIDDDDILYYRLSLNGCVEHYEYDKSDFDFKECRKTVNKEKLDDNVWFKYIKELYRKSYEIYNNSADDNCGNDNGDDENGSDNENGDDENDNEDCDCEINCDELLQLLLDDDLFELLSYDDIVALLTAFGCEYLLDDSNLGDLDLDEALFTTFEPNNLNVENIECVTCKNDISKCDSLINEFKSKHGVPGWFAELKSHLMKTEI